MAIVGIAGITVFGFAVLGVMIAIGWLRPAKD
jgi:hypothetical protein